MKVSHHPGEEFLLDYASGALGEAWSLAIATHLALCPNCRQQVAELEAIGGLLLDSTAAEPIGDDLLERILYCIDEPQEAPADAITAEPAPAQPPVLPDPLRTYVGGDVDRLNWQRLGLGASQLLIPTGSSGATARLLRIPAGRPVPTHTHGGLEFTLVLTGAFSDSTGTYARGDLQEADASLEHQPHALPGEDCICLAITDAPLRFKSLAARIVQPFLGI
jgi:putative transcriptional regulator